ncbi:MarR family transcriptional regulator [Neobacillus sp. 3P2-tot-E-2]|uniref:MarR family winged helix-turn-helix transcriptional regulator n=1 Tax=Neobacillus sp. 3P2-tot-E-2 TaxID=3132212 RepID=UPI00399F9451
MSFIDRDKWYGSLIKRIYRNVDLIFSQYGAKFGLNTSQLQVLVSLWTSENRGLTQKELVEILGFKPASVTALINSMESKGLIYRKLDPQDARVNRIFLTMKGIEMEEFHLKQVDVIEKCLTYNFTDDELKVMQIQLKKMLNNLETSLENVKIHS